MKLTPEDFAEKVFLKIGKSNKKPAIIRLLFDLIGEKSNFMKSPDEFNQKLAREMLDKSTKDLAQNIRSQHGEQEYIQHYLNSRRMSEILQYLKDRHILKHIPSKLAIQKEMYPLPGRVRRDSYERFGERFGGKPSAYKKNNLDRKSSRLLQKPKARNLVYAAIKEANIQYDCERFMLSAFFIALKKRRLSTYKEIFQWFTRSLRLLIVIL